MIICTRFKLHVKHWGLICTEFWNLTNSQTYPGKKKIVMSFWTFFLLIIQSLIAKGKPKLQNLKFTLGYTSFLYRSDLSASDFLVVTKKSHWNANIFHLILKLKLLCEIESKVTLKFSSWVECKMDRMFDGVEYRTKWWLCWKVNTFWREIYFNLQEVLLSKFLYGNIFFS